MTDAAARRAYAYLLASHDDDRDPRERALRRHVLRGLWAYMTGAPDLGAFD